MVAEPEAASPTTPVEPVVADVAQPAATQGPVTAPAAPAREFTEAEIAAYLASKTHEDLKGIKAYNDQVNRGLDRVRKTWEREQAEQAREASVVAEYRSYYDGLKQTNPAQLLELLENPEHAAMYQKVRSFKGGGSGDPRVVVRQIADNFRRQVEEDERFEGIEIDWDEVFSKGPSGAVYHVADRLIKKEQAALDKRLKDEMGAMRTSILAELSRTATQPSTPAGAPAGNSSAPVSIDEWAAMSSGERGRYKEEHPDWKRHIDLAAAERQAR